MSTVAPHEPTLQHLRDVVGAPIALWIGTEGGERMIAGLHLARTQSGCMARLVCAVVPADEAVARALRVQARELALPTAHVLQPDEAELAACLEVADLVIRGEELRAPSEIAGALVTAFPPE